ASLRPGLADDDVVDLGNLRFTRVRADLLEDRHEALAEPVERLLRLPDIENLHAAASAHEGEVIRPTGRRALPGLFQFSDPRVVLVLGEGRTGEIDAKCHESLPRVWIGASTLTQ